ncbi:MAG: hypothetical protein HC859_16200 [Bacteroidia bacterium]|nr:hypothetical protein [Bacteroidia bacterium]
MKRWIILISLVSHISLAQANESITGSVVAVVDGNTLQVKSGNDTYTILLWGIDSPELAQSYGGEAKKYLENSRSKKW